MNLHEFQAKQILRQYQLPVPRGQKVDTVESVGAAVSALGGGTCVVKAQIHAGGRGKAGGVRLVHSAEAAKALAKQLLGNRLVTVQNAPEGQRVDCLLLEEALPIAQELYLSLLTDRSAGRVAVIASRAGGMEIEEVAQLHPELILRELCDPINGLMAYQCRNLGFALGLSGETMSTFVQVVKTLYRLYVEQDLALLEINPIIVTTDGQLSLLDCKMVMDDNARYRHRDLADQYDWDQDDPKEREAHRSGLNYITLRGNIGCMVNGAGLAMATMDLIQLHGGSPANFLDVGGGANAQTVTNAFKIILADPQIKAVLVNIFGGIMRCDIIAEGIINAVKEVGVLVPVVVRLEGTNVEQGRQMLQDSGLQIITSHGLTDAARQVVAAARGEL